MPQTSRYSLLIVIFALIALVGVAQGMNLSQDDAYTAVLSHVLDGNTEGTWVYADPAPVPAGTTIPAMYGSVVLPETEGWLFFIDDAPMAGWAHPCRYVHVDTTGTVTVKKANGPPRALQEWTMVAGSVSEARPAAGTARIVSRGIGGILPPSTDTNHSYAVLISGGANLYNNWERYYGDVSFMYRTLVNEYGYQDDHIYVLMADGADPGLDQHTYDNGYISSDPDLDGDGDDDVGYAATKENITAVFNTLQTTLGVGDQVFVFTTDHGGPEDEPQQGTNVVLNLWDWTDIKDDEFAAEVDRVPSTVPVMITMEQCYSGGFVDDIVPGHDGQKRVIATAASAYESSWADTFSTLWISAVAGHDKSGRAVDADTISDGTVSMREAFTYAKVHDNEAEHPQYAESPAGVGANLALSSWYAPSLTADFTATRTSGYYPLAVRFEDTSTGLPTSWSWTFGDGTTSTEQNPTHTYTTAGTYTVNLTIGNATGQSSGPVSGVITVRNSSELGDAVEAPTLTWTTDTDAEWTVDHAVTHDGQDAARSGAIGGLAVSNLSTSVTGPASVSFWWKVSSETDYDMLHLLVDGVESAAITGEVDWVQQDLLIPSGPHTLAWIYSKDSAFSSGSDAGWVDQVVVATPTPAPTPAVTAGFYAFGHVGQAPYSARFLDQSTGSPTAWHWDFGDGTTSNEQSPTHIYNQTGAYNVALTVSNDLASDTAVQYRCVIVNTVPVANFTANATAGRTPFTVQFTDQSTGADGYQWQFGDGTTSTEQNPGHTYTHPGTYTVTEVVSGVNYGSVSMQKQGYITVTDPPTVGFSANVTAGLSPLAVQFNESVNGSVQYYYWQFGDGGTSFDRNPVHLYDTAGKYTVSLYAIGPNGTEVKTVDDCINVTTPVVPTATTPAPVNTTTVPTTPAPTNTTVAPTVTTVTPTVTAGIPYNGPQTIPGTLQAEDYDLGGEGIAYHDTTTGNEGGAYRQDDVDIEVLDTDHSPNIGWIRAGEWLTYTVNITTDGTYDAGFRVASSHSGSSVQVYFDDGTIPVATVNVPNTGDWPAFQTVQVPVTLPAGQHRLKLTFPTDYVNVNWITFALRG